MEHIIPSYLCENYVCDNIAYKNGLCKIHLCDNSYNAKKQSMLCLYKAPYGINSRSLIKCQNVADVNLGICKRCYKSYFCGFYLKLNKNAHSVLNDFCLYDQYENLLMLLNKMTFSQNQLTDALEIAFDGQGDNCARILLLYKNFFPDLSGYDFLFGINKPSQSTLSLFFYKRFLIKTYILSISIHLIYIIPKILDPFMLSTNKSYHSIKPILHLLLFP